MTKPRRNTFRILASRESIDNSERNSLHWCIAALAVMDSVPGSQHVAVDSEEMRFSYKGMRYSFKTPPKTAAIASDYDKGYLTKSQIEPWEEVLKDPISVTPVQHKRPMKGKTKHVKRSRKTKQSRTTRWGGRRVV